MAVPDEEYIVEGLLGKRLKSGAVEYRVKWEGFALTEATWEPASALSCDDHVVAFEKGATAPPSKPSIGKKPKGGGNKVLRARPALASPRFPYWVGRDRH
eukprot:SAG11_NODE_1493_length_4805_cov_14.583510_5_plen_100_part_00